MTTEIATRLQDVGTVVVIIILIGLVVQRHAVSRRPAASSELGVADLVTRLKNELDTLERQRINEDKLSPLAVDSADIELHFVVRRTDSASLKAGYDLVTIDAGSSYGSESVQTVTLHMKPTPDRREAIDSNSPPHR